MEDCKIPTGSLNPGTPQAPVSVVTLHNTTLTFFTLTPLNATSCKVAQYPIPANNDKSPTCDNTFETPDCGAFVVAPDTSITGDPNPSISTPEPSQSVGGPSNTSSSSKPSLGVIVGSAIGGLVVVVVALAFLIMYRRRGQKRQNGGGPRGKEEYDEGGDDQEQLAGEEGGRGSRSRSDDVLIQTQDQSLGHSDGRNGASQQNYHQSPTSPYSQTYNNNNNNASLPLPPPSGLPVPLSSPSALNSATTVTQSTPVNVPRAVSPLPVNIIDYQPKSTYQPTVPANNNANNNKNNRYHSHTQGTTTVTPTNLPHSSSSYSIPSSGELAQSGQGGDYIDLIPVEDTPQLVHAVLPSGSKGRGRARALENYDEEEEAAWEAEQRGLLNLGSGGRPQQQHQQQQGGGRGKNGKVTSVLDEDEEEIDEKEIKYL